MPATLAQHQSGLAFTHDGSDEPRPVAMLSPHDSSSMHDMSRDGSRLSHDGSLPVSHSEPVRHTKFHHQPVPHQPVSRSRGRAAKSRGHTAKSRFDKQEEEGQTASHGRIRPAHRQEYQELLEELSRTRN